MVKSHNRSMAKEPGPRLREPPPHEHNEDPLDFASFRAFLLAAVQLRSLEAVLEAGRRFFQSRPWPASACIWVVDRWTGTPVEGVEDGCREAPVLRLLTHFSRTRTEPTTWPHACGDTFARVPFDEPVIGEVARSRAQRCARIGDGWLRPDWAEAEGIVEVLASPMLSHDELMGVFGVFFLDHRDGRPGEGEAMQKLLADVLAGVVYNDRFLEDQGRARQQLESENEYLRTELRQAQGFGGIRGKSPELAEVVRQIEQVAVTDAIVLITGESGTGKELVAQAIHEHSRRSKRAFVKVNCAAVPRDLFESEFFGHVRGAFTGASQDRQGRFQLANQGTLFLDEVGEIPLELQSKLLRVLQDGTFERVGESVPRTAAVRVIAATNRDLRAEVSAGRFRSDLYYRLAVFPIEIPPLRQRRDDIAPLVDEAVGRVCARLGFASRPSMTQHHLALLSSYDWPGNVRELYNVIERALILTGGRGMDLRFLRSSAEPVEPGSASPRDVETRIVTEEEWTRLRRQNIRLALEKAGGRIQGEGGAAALLGVRPSTLRSQLRAMGIATGRE